MGNMGTTSEAFKGSIKSAHDASPITRASLSSESDSIEQILKEANKQGMGNKSIIVSRQVQIARSMP